MICCFIISCDKEGLGRSIKHVIIYHVIFTNLPVCKSKFKLILQNTDLKKFKALCGK